MRSRLFAGAASSILLTFMNIPGAQAVGVSGQGTWETTLEPRSLDTDLNTVEAYYDTALDITWLANPALMNDNLFGLTPDSSLTAYSGDSQEPDSLAYIDTTGDTEATWAGAMRWIEEMNAANYLGENEWRLPWASPIDGVDWDTSPDAYDGTTDEGWAQTGVGWVDGFGGTFDASGRAYSELGYMFYVTLGNTGVCAPGADPACEDSTANMLTNTGYFDNLDPDRYWTIAQFGNDPTKGGLNYASMRFRFDTGNQNRADKDGTYNTAWAVIDGDRGTALTPVPVPLPAAVWLFGTGLLGLAGISGRRKATG